MENQNIKRCCHCMQEIKNESSSFCPHCGRSLEQEEHAPQYLPPGTILQGRFLVGNLLGTGGFGNTYIGWNQRLSCKVAIKEFYPRQYCCRGKDRLTVTLLNPEQKERFHFGMAQFLEEARSVASLQDIPGVVTISSYFRENNTAYLVMEYLEGMDVKRLLASRGGKMEYSWCREVTLSLLYTLQEIHKRGVLHRDIAPDNVFITNTGMVKLIDFGAARHMSALGEASSEIVLKAGYAPIEQYSRNAPQGPYTDLYAAAAFFYRILTGQRPLPANERLQEDHLILPSEMGIEIPKQAELGMMVCLNVQPEYRLQNAGDFMEALDGRNYVPTLEFIREPLEDGTLTIKKKSGLPLLSLKKAGIALGAASFLGVLIFIFFSMRGTAYAERSLTDTSLHMMDLTGLTLEEANERLEELEEQASRQGIHFDFILKSAGTIFDLDKGKQGTIATQTVAPAAILYDADTSKQKKVKGLRKPKRSENGDLTGTILCETYTHKKLYYRELADLNAYEIAQKLGLDTEDTDIFIGEEKKNTCYYDLIELQVGDEIITPEQLKTDGEKKLAYKDNQIRILYSNVPFFYWYEENPLPDFKAEYESLDAIPAQKIYIEKDMFIIELSGEKRHLEEVEGIVSTSYCSISAGTWSDSYHKGDIVRQTVDAGSKLNTGRNRMKAPLLYVIGEEVFYDGKTGNQLKEELEQWSDHVTVVAGGSGVMNQPVNSVKIADAKGNVVEYFKKDTPVTVTLELKEVSASPTVPSYGGNTYSQPSPQGSTNAPSSHSSNNTGVGAGAYHSGDGTPDQESDKTVTSEFSMEEFTPGPAAAGRSVDH